MVKKILSYLVSFLVLFCVSYVAHFKITETLNILLPFSLLHIYIFFFSASFLICSFFIFFSTIEKWTNQLGFIYMYSMLIKLLLFVAVFRHSIFKIEALSRTESINLLMPFIFFLILEVLFIVKVLSKK